jgi:hypothetical protein
VHKGEGKGHGEAGEVRGMAQKRGTAVNQTTPPRIEPSYVLVVGTAL